MTKSFSLTIFSIACLIAQALCGRLDAQNNRLELSETPSLADSPFLSCVLLKSVSACTETCYLIGSIYGQPIASGICSERDECLCKILPEAPLEEYWIQKFDNHSKNVLGEIRKDEALSNKVLDVLKIPFQTYQETISALESLLKEDQLKNLHPKDKDAQNIFVTDDKFEAVKKYVEKNVKPIEPANADETKKYLTSVIEKSNGAYFNRIYQEVCRSQNELLIEALNEYNKKRSIETSACSRKEDEGNVIRLIDVETVNKLIKMSSSKPSNRSDPSTEPEESDTKAQNLNTDDVWWKLAGLKKSEVEELKQGKKKWKLEGQSFVSLKKISSGLTLTWYNEKHRVEILMNNVYDDKITQQWNFPNVYVELNKKVNETRTQKWQFENSTYEATINSKGQIRRAEWEGKEKSSLLKEYKQRIDTWCGENDYIVGKDNCIIY